MTADEPTAIRYLGKKWHRTIHDVTPRGVFGRLACGRPRIGATDMRLLSEVPTADRCRTCWPTTKEPR